MLPSVTTLTNIAIIVATTQEKRVLLAKEGEHGNVIYIVPPICINEEDVTEVIFMIMVTTIIPFVSLQCTEECNYLRTVLMFTNVK